jgi:CheY-like chemotaxis protein
VAAKAKDEDIRQRELDDEGPGTRPTRAPDFRNLFRAARVGLSGEIQRSWRVIESVRETLARADAALAAAQGQVEPRTRTHRHRILIVDDSEDTASYLQRGLAAFGHLVEAVHTPSSAIVLAKYFAPDIALLDIGLPEVDGWALAQQLRKHVRAIHIIAVTGYSRDVDRQRSLAAGFVEHIVKPVEIPSLARIVGELAPAA